MNTSLHSGVSPSSKFQEKEGIVPIVPIVPAIAGVVESTNGVRSVGTILGTIIDRRDPRSSRGPRAALAASDYAHRAVPS